MGEFVQPDPEQLLNPYSPSEITHRVGRRVNRSWLVMFTGFVLIALGSLVLKHEGVTLYMPYPATFDGVPTMPISSSLSLSVTAYGQLALGMIATGMFLCSIDAIKRCIQRRQSDV